MQTIDFIGAVESLQKITKSHVDRLSTPASGQAFVRDSDFKGFAVRVTSSGAKAFILEKRIDGKVKRLTLGRYPELTVEQAILRAVTIADFKGAEGLKL